ncbi:ABC transporter permease [Pseudonocardia xishanensis]|uniref:Autoinducer 2 import system permease protein LsrD n=1 Tax=Pseudonocardia xishanensis TaxID=630995 RepID=A0ABP8RET4_9PSEU
MTQTQPERALRTPPERRPRTVTADGGATLHLFGRFGLPMLLVLVVALFSFWKPASFFAWSNFNATFAQQAIIVMVALGAMVPLIVGEFDLSIGANAGFAAILTVGLSELQGLPPWLAILLAVAASAVIGLLNGLIITRLRVNSFVATLGTATAIGGIGQLYTDQRDIQSVPPELLTIGRATFAGLPITVIVAVVVAALLAVVLQLLPIGRQLLAVGANRKAAELTGIRPELRIVTAFVMGGVIAGIGGALYGANLGAAGNQTGATLLLPAFAGAFLGSTTITPGRYNVLGTLVAVLLLAFTVSGLEQVGVQPWIEAVVQGFALIAAVGFSSWAIRRRTQLMRNAQLALLAAQDTAAPTPKEPA